MGLPFNGELPSLEELAPEEVQYLLQVCRKLRDLGILTEKPSPSSDDVFDRDELGIDPEDDYDLYEGEDD